MKVFLITRPPDLGGVPALGSAGNMGSVRIIAGAVSRIYSEGGVLAFWTGNGLSVAKIFPESAIKFFAYESAASLATCFLVFSLRVLILMFQKRAFAKYWDHVDDPREISSVSRFLSGGIGGISSQLSERPATFLTMTSLTFAPKGIYPLETLKVIFIVSGMVPGLMKL